MGELSGQERRRYVRVHAQLIMNIEIFDGSLSEVRSLSKNVSQGGLLFEFDRKFNLGTILGLELRVPEVGKRIFCYVKVVRVEEVVEEKLYDIGVSFLKIEDKDFESLGQYVSMNVRKRV